jgi:hypothetical protein
MLTEKEEILISSYQDDELSPDEFKEAEELLNEKPEAKLFLAMLIEGDKKLDVYYAAINIDKMADNFSNFVSNKLEKKISFLDRINPFNNISFSSLSKPIMQYSFSLALLVSIGTNFYFYNEGNFSLDEFDSNNILVREFNNSFETVGSTDDTNNIEYKVESVISEMIDLKKSLAEIIMNQDLLKINLTSKTFEGNNIKCYAGKYSISAKESSFNYCISEKKTSIIFSN